jgi:transcription elongation factor SPT6
MTELRRSNVGDFLFRPSSKGTNNITLTWYFYMNCFVHVDIREEDKLIGTSIGNRLYIGDSVFEKLEEIVERYILPCNRALKEAKDHPKFVHSSSLQEFEEKLK